MMGRFPSGEKTASSFRFLTAFKCYSLKRTTDNLDKLRMRLLIEVMSDFHWKIYFIEPSMRTFL